MRGVLSISVLQVTPALFLIEIVQTFGSGYSHSAKHRKSGGDFDPKLHYIFLLLKLIVE